MADWYFEHGIGEDRAALIDNGRIIEARVEPHDGGPKPGTVTRARMTEVLAGRSAGLARLDDGEEILVAPLAKEITQGLDVTVEITRMRIAEPGRAKRAQARIAARDAGQADGPTLEERLNASNHTVIRLASHDKDALEDAEWSAVLEQAETGSVAFAGGALRISLTPAMTVIDVDGALRPAELASAGAAAAGSAIRRLDICGSVVIDLPTLSSKTERQAAADAFDNVLPKPFERTAVNGFGLLQIVRKKARPSLMEIFQYDRGAALARALLRRAERSAGIGPQTITGHPAVVAHLSSDWIGELQRRLGCDVMLKEDPALQLSGGHVSSAQPR
jgi:hypothetical protein